MSAKKRIWEPFPGFVEDVFHMINSTYGWLQEGYTVRGLKKHLNQQDNFTISLRQVKKIVDLLEEIGCVSIDNDGNITPGSSTFEHEKFNIWRRRKFEDKFYGIDVAAKSYPLGSD